MLSRRNMARINPKECFSEALALIHWFFYVPSRLFPAQTNFVFAAFLYHSLEFDIFYACIITLCMLWWYFMIFSKPFSQTIHKNTEEWKFRRPFPSSIALHWTIFVVAQAAWSQTPAEVSLSLGMLLRFPRVLLNVDIYVWRRNSQKLI